MAPNLLLIALTLTFSGLAPKSAKASRMHRLYDFIVETQTRRAAHEVARYLERTRKEPVRG